MYRKVLKVVTVLTTFIFLLACSPKLDWRKVQSPQERYTAFFPAKPDKIERRTPYQDQELLQTLEAVKVDNDIYSISVIHLPAAQSASLNQLLSELKVNLVDRAKASGGDVVIEEGFYKTADRQRLPTKDYFIDLKANGKTQQIMRVRWINRVAANGDHWIYQISVLHTDAGKENLKTFLSKEEYENFFSDFSPE